MCVPGNYAERQRSKLIEFYATVIINIYISAACSVSWKLAIADAVPF